MCLNSLKKSICKYLLTVELNLSIITFRLKPAPIDKFKKITSPESSVILWFHYNKAVPSLV